MQGVDKLVPLVLHQPRELARNYLNLERPGHTFGEQAFELRGQQGFSSEQAQELIALSSALDRLEHMNPQQRQIRELRYFGGLSLEEAAEALGVSNMTVKRDWMAARAWLKGQVRPEAMP